MADPATREEYDQLALLNSEPFGYGIDTGQRMACPFCAAPGFTEWKIMEMAINDYEPMRVEKTCASCGRSAKMLVEVTDGGVSTELVQTGGDDPPEYLRPWPRRV